MKYLLDTCVLSEFVRPVPAAEVQAWMAAREEADLYIAAMTLAELHRGVKKLPPSHRKSDLSVWVEELRASFGERILPFAEATAAYWGDLCAGVEAKGRPMAAFDSIIAATALEHGLALVTRNVCDFAHAPLLLVNPWEQTV